DAAADAVEFKNSGLEAHEVFHFARQATLPDGSQAEVKFSLAFVTEPSMPEAAFFTCQQHAPQHFWRPEFQRHANRARRIAEVVMSAARPGDHKDFVARLIGARDGSFASGFSIPEEGEPLTMVHPAA